MAGIPPPPQISMDLLSSSSDSHSPLRRAHSDGDAVMQTALTRHIHPERHSHDILIPPYSIRPLPNLQTRDRYPIMHRPDNLVLEIPPLGPTPRPILDRILIAPETPAAVPSPVQPAPPPQSYRSRLLAFFGYGSDPSVRERKDLVSLLWNFAFNGIQILIIIVLLSYSSGRKGRPDSRLGEWTSCSRPLGSWNAIWVIKLAADGYMAHWNYSRERASRVSINPDVESSPNPTPTNNNNRTPPNLSSSARSRNRAPSPHTVNHPPPSNLYARLSIFLSFFSLIWFLVANILLYTKVSTCRKSSPHLWWLTFGVVSITYLMILELLLLGLVVFVLGPIVYLVWNIFLICIGHHPLQNPHYIKPDIGKLSKSVVDRIPLVLYIPPPDDEGPIAKPDLVHTYPPLRPAPPTTRRRFAFLRGSWPWKGRPKSDNEKGKNSEKMPSGGRWEDNWERGEYPFVQLEGNRAACAICLMDFEEPKRVKVVGVNEETKEEIPSIARKPGEDETFMVTEEERLKLTDAGEGAQPLRLLACGHVFHQTCLDPWLTGVSGRCPVCQRPVELPETEQKSKRSRNR